MDSFNMVALPTAAEEIPVRDAAQDAGAQTIGSRVSTDGVGRTYYLYVVCVVA